MAFFKKILGDALSQFIALAAAFIAGFIAWLYFGDTSQQAVYTRAMSDLTLPHWLVWLWIVVTGVLAIAAVALALRKRQPDRDVASKPPALAPKIEMRCGDEPPYSVTDISSGQAYSRVSIGIRNAGGEALSNCKVYINKVSPPTSAVSGDVRFLEGGIHLRHDDKEHITDIASHWRNTAHFMFNAPHSSGFFDTGLQMDDSIRRSIEIRVVATECERSALFEIWADESKTMHLKFVNYLN